MSNSASPPTDLAQTFALILDGLCRAVAARMAKHPISRPLLMLFWGRVRRTMARFATLVERAGAGRLPPPRQHATRPPTPKAERRPVQRLPGGFGWMCPLLPHEAACFGSQLRHLLSQPEMAALLDAAPQAGRLLRPLCRALAVPLPAVLAIPHRAAPSAPAPAQTTADSAGEPPPDHSPDQASDPPRGPFRPIPPAPRDAFAKG